MTAPTPPTLTNRLGTIASKLFVTTSAMQFSDLLEEFTAEVRNQALAEGAGHLDRIAGEIEARVADHYGAASGIGPGSADMVRESAKTLRALIAARGTQEG